MNRIRGLDGARGIASVCIVAFHVFWLGGYDGTVGLGDTLFSRSDCFVRLFFMLSGFSLMCAYYHKFCDGNFDTAFFLKRRALRLLPCFWLVELGWILINWISGSPNNLEEIIGTASLLFALFPTGQNSIVSAGWSMGIQAAFYLVFPVFLVICKTKRNTWMTFAVFAALLYAYTGFYGRNVADAHINIVRHMVYFVAGALLFHHKDPLAALSGRGRLLVALVCVAVEGLCLFLFPRINEDVTMLLAFSALITLQILGVDPIMRLPILTWLGSMSYEIYLFHPLVNVLLGKLAERGCIRINGYYMHLIIVLLISVILAFGFHHLFSAFMKQWECVFQKRALK